jgi:Kef-type K+ transport system membrane component KefB
MTSILHNVQSWVQSLGLPILGIVGLFTLAGFFVGKGIKHLRLPSIIGFMLVGVLLGPSLLNIINESAKGSLSFLTDVALGFVALSIGLELNFVTLKKLGPGIVAIIFAESLLAFGIVTTAVYLLTKDLPLALIFGGIAPASAPAGTVAVIQEYRASGSLTQALYTVVGFDDGLGIIIFGFVAAIARSILGHAAGAEAESIGLLILTPLKEIGLSLLVGGIISFVYVFLARGVNAKRDVFIINFAFVLLTIGIATALHLSLILTNLIVGMAIVNTQKSNRTHKIHDGLESVMPLLFVLFFVLAGANLHLNALPALGLIGIVYIASRAAGKLGGAWFGATVTRAEPKIKKYLGLGILSQAGVAIGLSLIVKKEFSGISEWGADIGAAVITTVTATSIIFEIIGPITCKLGLRKAGEIEQAKSSG